MFFVFVKAGERDGQRVESKKKRRLDGGGVDGLAAD